MCVELQVGTKEIYIALSVNYFFGLLCIVYNNLPCLFVMKYDIHDPPISSYLYQASDLVENRPS